MYRKFSFSLILPLFVIIPFIAFGQFRYSCKIPLHRLEKSEELNLSHYKGSNENGFYIGADLGFYFANSHTASYYNGSGINSVDSTIMYSYNYQQIKQLLNDYDFSLAELPARMHYSPAFTLGIYFKYAIKNSGILMQFHFSKLKTNDIFTISVNDPNNFSSDPTYKQESIWGTEQRAVIDLGYSYTFNPESNYRPFIQFGANLTDTKYIDNKINIEGLEYSITNYYYAYEKIEQGGVGLGGFAGGGMNLILNESISIMPTLNIQYTKIKLGENKNLRLNYSFYITAILNGIF